jgi:hypothetical protein
MESLYDFIIKLDSYFAELEEWLSNRHIVALRKKVFGLLDQEDALQDTLRQEEECEKVIRVVTSDILSIAQTDSIKSAREILFKAKTILNTYADRVSDSFIKELSLDSLSREQLIEEAKKITGD